jgi:ribonuclease P protein component
MLKKSLRLTTKELEQVIKSGRVAHSTLFTLRFVAAETSKYAAVVSKKVGKTAVARNSAKRRTHEALGQLLPSIKPGVHAVLFVKDANKAIPVADFVADLKLVFKKAGL